VRLALILAFVWTTSLGVARAQDAAREVASSHFRMGVARMQSGDLRGALREFEEAQRIAPAPATLWNVCVVRVQLLRHAQARVCFATYLEAEGTPPERREEATRQLRAMERELAELRVRPVPESAALRLDGEPFDGHAWVQPGRHVIEGEARDHELARRAVTLRPGTLHEIDFVLPSEGSGRLAITSPISSAEAAIDGGDYQPLPLEIPIEPGEHEVLVRGPGLPPVRSSVAVRPAQRAEIVLPEGTPDTGALEIESDPPARVAVDGAFVGHTPLELPAVGSRPIRLEIAAEGRRAWSGIVEVPAGEELDVDATLVANDAREPGVVFWAGVGLTGALAIATAVTGGLALADHDTFQRYIDQGATRSDPDALSVANRGEILTTTTNVLLALAGTLAIATIAWLIFGGEPVPSRVEID
jgi:hypothetical protein